MKSDKLSKKERILSVLMKENTDRISASFWRHFYEYEFNADELADIMLRYQREMDWDFIKVNSRSSYYEESWGCTYDFYKDGRKPVKTDYPIKSLKDFNRIIPLNPLKTPPLWEQLDAFHLINKGLREDIFFIATIFTPLSIIAELVENSKTLKKLLCDHPDIIHNTLKNITDTFQKFLEEAINTGISGVFYATRHWAGYDYLTQKQFDEFCRPYDLKLLDIVKDCPFNILHICYGNNMLDHLYDYPAKAFHWDCSDPTNPSLEKGKEIVKSVLIGGINHKKTILHGSIKDCLKEAEKAFSITDGKGWILGAGCTYPPQSPLENLKALREWTEKI